MMVMRMMAEDRQAGERTQNILDEEKKWAEQENVEVRERCPPCVHRVWRPRRLYVCMVMMGNGARVRSGQVRFSVRWPRCERSTHISAFKDPVALTVFVHLGSKSDVRACVLGVGVVAYLVPEPKADQSAASDVLWKCQYGGESMGIVCVYPAVPKVHREEHDDDDGLYDDA